ncbi:hypothetical protein HPB50_027478 [Hyalomma asiaticum]|uniref:Uncharacterized protein n=1 Tax=Hyalomma asiaticum TaxID=266040 RepID=A0ACB7T7R3_HYAAI|nr:hypothetical protein HPB50_027478 [Hyalomma asiaticum]
MIPPPERSVTWSTRMVTKMCSWHTWASRPARSCGLSFTRFFALYIGDCRGSFQSSVGREEHIGMAQSAVSNTYEVTEAIIISVAARAVRRKLVDFPPTPWLPRMRRRRRLRYSAKSQAC